MPPWVRTVADWLPFRYMLGFPVQLMIGMTTRAETLNALVHQWGMIAGLVLLAIFTWRKGIRRFEAFGA